MSRLIEVKIRGDARPLDRELLRAQIRMARGVRRFALRLKLWRVRYSLWLEPPITGREPHEATPKDRMLAALVAAHRALEQMPESKVRESFTGGYRDVVVEVRYFATLDTGTKRDSD